MVRGYSAQQVRDAEKPHLAAGEPLMQRAAHALAQRILALLESRAEAGSAARVLLLVGSGDNGGDALFAGAELARSELSGRRVEVYALGVGSRMHEAGFADAIAAGVHPIDPTDLMINGLPRGVGDFDAIVDGIVGTGTSAGSPALRGLARRVVSAVLSGLAKGDVVGGRPVIVAVDIPSGVDPNSGAVADDAVLPADVTVTFGGVKAGLLRGEGARLAGRVDLVEIGIEADLAAMTPVIDLS